MSRPPPVDDLEVLEPLHPCCVKDREEAARGEKMDALLYANDFVRKRFEERRGILGGYYADGAAAATFRCSDVSHSRCDDGTCGEDFCMPGLPIGIDGSTLVSAPHEESGSEQEEGDGGDAEEEEEDFDDDYFLDDPALDALSLGGGGSSAAAGESAAERALLAAAMDDVQSTRALEELFHLAPRRGGRGGGGAPVCLLLTASESGGLPPSQPQQQQQQPFDALERCLRRAALSELARPQSMRTRFVRFAAHPDRSSAMRGAMDRAHVAALPAVVALVGGAVVDAVECAQTQGESGCWGQFGLLDVSADKLEGWLTHAGLAGDRRGRNNARGGGGGDADEEESSGDEVRVGWACGNPSCGNPVPHQHVTEGFWKDASNVEDFLKPL